MDKSSFVLYVTAILFIGFLLYFLTKFFVSYYKLRRLSNFSLKINEYEKDNVGIVNLVRKTTKFLEALVIFNGLSKTYDKYIYEDSRLKKGMDYVSIKILLGLFFIIMYIVLCTLFNDTLTALMILVNFVIGFLIPDFYCSFVRNKRHNILTKNIISAIIIMNNSYKATGTTEQAIIDVIERTDGNLSTEFNKVLNDVRLGLDVSDAFMRFYDRVHIYEMKYIARVLSLVNKSGISLVEAFDLIERRLIKKEKFNNELNNIKSVNNISLVVFSLLPLIFIISLLGFNETYLKVLFSYSGVFVILIMLLLYLLYLLIIHNIVRGDKYDR